MNIDENAEDINMSDHNLLRAWFRIGRGEMIKWEKKRYEIRTWYRTDDKTLKNMKEDLLSRISRYTSFNNMMDKVEIS